MIFYNEGIGKVEKKTKLHIIVLPIIFVFSFNFFFDQKTSLIHMHSHVCNRIQS